MSGCYGSSKEDRYFEARLFEYLDSQTSVLETPEGEAMFEQMWKERVSDLRGYLSESFSEASEDRLKVLSDLILEWNAAPTDRERDIRLKIGSHVIDMIDAYCEPSEEDVSEAIGEYE